MVVESRREFLELAGAFFGTAFLPIEIPPAPSQSATNEDVFNAILARLKAETGELYTEIDEVLLAGERGERIYMGFYTPSSYEPYQQTWIEIHTGQSSENYLVRRGQTRLDSLWQIDVETGEASSISPASNFRALFQAQSIRNKIIHLVTTAQPDSLDNPLSVT